MADQKMASIEHRLEKLESTLQPVDGAIGTPDTLSSAPTSTLCFGALKPAAVKLYSVARYP
jgi:hypothetical protein